MVISGGEPYLLKDMWLRIFRRYHDMYFLTYTNGTLVVAWIDRYAERFRELTDPIWEAQIAGP